jgi:hypothetical protein
VLQRRTWPCKTVGRCDLVVNASSRALLLQAQDRCHRIGQTRPVHIYRLVSVATIEENILAKSDQKRQVRCLRPGTVWTNLLPVHTLLLCSLCVDAMLTLGGSASPAIWGLCPDALNTNPSIFDDDLCFWSTAGPPGDPVGGLQHRVPVQDQPPGPAGGRRRRCASL